MKKFIKYTLIIGCVLILGGAGIATVAFSLGGDPFHAVEDIDDRFEAYGERFGQRAERYYSTTATEVPEMPVETEVSEQIEVTEIALNGERYEFVQEYDEVTDLEIQIRGGNITVQSDDTIDQVIVKGISGDPAHMTYSLLEKYQKLEINAAKDEEYVILIPEGWKLSDFEVECVGGNFEGENIRTNEADFTVTGGSVTAHQIGGKKTSLECTGGSITWSGEGELSRNIDVECTGGEVTLALDNAGVDTEKVGYDIEYRGGALELFGVTYTGSGAQKRNAIDGMPHLELEITGGRIYVE